MPRPRWPPNSASACRTGSVLGVSWGEARRADSAANWKTGRTRSNASCFPSTRWLAHKLADSFLRADKYFFEQADDSDGAIGDAIRAGCRLWLHSAKAQPAKSADHWVERIHALESADEYGAREELLRASDTLFDEAGLRTLAGRFDADLTKALAAKRETERTDYAMYKAAAAIGLIADALRDPDLSTQTTLRYSPNPNPMQKEQFAERYIRFGRAKDALPWLEGDWGHAEDRRLRLQAEAYVALGDSRPAVRGPASALRANRNRP